MSQVFVHVFALDGNRVGVFAVVADLAFVCRWQFGQEKKHEADA
jgi:hypothetical protein